MMIAARQETGTGRGTERRRVHVVIEQSVFRKPVDVRRLHWRSIASKLTETGIVQNDEENVRRSGPSAQRLRPSRSGFRDRASQHSGKCRTGLVFDQFIRV